MLSRSHTVGVFSDPKESTVGQKISMDAAAENLGVNKRTVQRLIASDELPAYRIGTKIVRVDADDVAKLLKPINGDNGAAAGNGGVA